MPAERAQLLELAERVEKAEGASRELDAEIMAIQHFQDDRAIGGQIGDGHGKWMPIKDRVWVSRATDKWVGTHPRDFTSSLDAALTLVPEGWAVTRFRIWPGNGPEQSRLDLVPVHEHEPGLWWRIHARNRDAVSGVAAKPALALCAASLRALAAQHQEEGSSDAG